MFLFLKTFFKKLKFKQQKGFWTWVKSQLYMRWEEGCLRMYRRGFRGLANSKVYESTRQSESQKKLIGFWVAFNI